MLVSGSFKSQAAYIDSIFGAYDVQQCFLGRQHTTVGFETARNACQNDYILYSTNNQDVNTSLKMNHLFEQALLND